MASKIKKAINKMSLAEIKATEFMNFKCFYKIYNKVKHKVSFVEFIKFQTIHQLRGQKLRVKIDDETNVNYDVFPVFKEATKYIRKKNNDT